MLQLFAWLIKSEPVHTHREKTQKQMMGGKKKEMEREDEPDFSLQW